MAKNRKTSGSKKFIATLSYLVAPSDAQIDQMEATFHLSQELEARFPFFDFEEDRFLDWMMEIEDAEFDQMNDMYICLAMERRWREHNTHEARLFRRLEQMESPWPSLDFDCGSWDYDGLLPDQDSHAFDDTLPDVDDCQIHGYESLNYWDDDWDIQASMREFDESICPEQAIVRELPLRGLKYAHRRALIREYCVA